MCGKLGFIVPDFNGKFNIRQLIAEFQQFFQKPGPGRFFCRSIKTFRCQILNFKINVGNLGFFILNLLFKILFQRLQFFIGIGGILDPVFQILKTLRYRLVKFIEAQQRFIQSLLNFGLVGFLLLFQC